MVRWNGTCTSLSPPETDTSVTFLATPPSLSLYHTCKREMEEIAVDFWTQLQMVSDDSGLIPRPSPQIFWYKTPSERGQR